MNKMNKKGFTLIEMLVVIAIIAVLNGDVAKDTSGTSMPANYGTTPVAKSDGAGAFAYTVDANGAVTVNFGSGNDIDHFADIADNGKADGSNGATPSSSVTPDP